MYRLFSTSPPASTMACVCTAPSPSRPLSVSLGTSSSLVGRGRHAGGGGRRAAPTMHAWTACGAVLCNPSAGHVSRTNEHVIHHPILFAPWLPSRVFHEAIILPGWALGPPISPPPLATFQQQCVHVVCDTQYCWHPSPPLYVPPVKATFTSCPTAQLASPVTCCWRGARTSAPILASLAQRTSGMR